MPLARIITRNPEDARALQQELAERGYEVAYADPSALIAEPADLEIDLDRVPLEEGLRLASHWAAENGADVYVAPGALPEIKQAEPIASIPAQPREEVGETAPRGEVLRETITHAAGVFTDSLHETKEAVGQSFSDLKQRFAHDAEAQPSRLQRWSRALAERRAQRQELKARERDVARQMREEHEQERARAAALARERQEQERLHAEARAREQQEHERIRAEALARQETLARQAREHREQQEREKARVEALARDAQQRRAREAAPRPAIVTGSVAPVIKPPVLRPGARPVLERRSIPARRLAQRDEGAEYWRGAFTGAAVVAAVLMIAWATLGTSHAPAAGHSSGQIKQDVPFGPVTLTPGAAPAKPATPAPTATQPAEPAPPTRSMTPAPKPAPVRTHRARRSSGGVADDEVIVHHFGAPKPAPAATTSNTTAKNAGPKRITDQ